MHFHPFPLINAFHPSIHSSTYFLTYCSLHQYPRQYQTLLRSRSTTQFGEAFEVVPRTLADNSGQDATLVMASLYEQHLDGKAPNVGVDIGGAGTCDAAAAGITDVLSTKESAVRLAVDAALTVLRVDQIIMSKKAGAGKK